MKPIPNRLIEVLACPECKYPVEQAADAMRCTNSACGRIFPIRNGIPTMLADQGRRSDIVADRRDEVRI